MSLPEGYHMEWHGEYDQLQDEKIRLAKIVPDHPVDHSCFSSISC